MNWDMFTFHSAARSKELREVQIYPVLWDCCFSVSTHYITHIQYIITATKSFIKIQNNNY